MRCRQFAKRARRVTLSPSGTSTSSSIAYTAPSRSHASGEVDSLAMRRKRSVVKRAAAASGCCSSRKACSVSACSALQPRAERADSTSWLSRRALLVAPPRASDCGIATLPATGSRLTTGAACQAHSRSTDGARGWNSETNARLQIFREKYITTNEKSVCMRSYSASRQTDAAMRLARHERTTNLKHRKVMLAQAYAVLLDELITTSARARGRRRPRAAGRSVVLGLCMRAYLRPARAPARSDDPARARNTDGYATIMKSQVTCSVVSESCSPRYVAALRRLKFHFVRACACMHPGRHTA